MEAKVMGRRNGLNIIMMAVIIILGFYVLFYYPDLIGLPVGASDIFIALFPGLFLTGISIYMLSHSHGAGSMAGMLGVGFGVVLLLSQADAEGLVTAEMLSGLTLDQLQIWVMVFSTVAGAVFYNISK